MISPDLVILETKINYIQIERKNTPDLSTVIAEAFTKMKEN